MSEHNRPKPKQTMPMFVFLRRRDIEAEAGYILAGRLVINKAQEEQVPAIIQTLLDKVLSDRNMYRMVGWYGDGGRPHNAVDTKDDEVMAAWRDKDCLTIDVRVNPRKDGLMRLDSDVMRQLEAGRPTD